MNLRIHFNQINQKMIKLKLKLNHLNKNLLRYFKNQLTFKQLLNNLKRN